ncbi:MAG: C25 family cysteine peptidase, partial [Calditrichota bacterium]
MSHFRSAWTWLLILIGLGFNSSVLARTPSQALRLHSQDAQSAHLSFTAPSADYREILSQVLTQPAGSSTALGIAGAPGHPALPAWSQWIEIPCGKIPKLQTQIKSEQLVSDLDSPLFPTLAEVQLKGSPALPSLSPNTITDEFQPAQVASLSKVMTIAGRKVVLVDVTPYRYNPVRRELRIAEEVEIEIQFIASNQAETPPRLELPPVYNELYSGITSFGNPHRDDYGERVDHLGRYVIVYANINDFLDVLTPYIEWKKRKGHPVTLVRLDAIGDRETDLANWLEAAWQEWDDPPVFVLLVGDAAGNARIPCFRDPRGVGQGWLASDNQYGAWEGENGPDLWVPEGFVGRWAVNTPAELRVVVAKALAYEMTPTRNVNWFEGAMLIANGVQSCTSTNMAVREIMQGAGYLRDDIHEAYVNYNQGRPDLNTIINAINDGVGFINFRGYNNWGDFYQQNIRRDLRNNFMLPVVTGIVCGTNDFTNTWQEDQPECRGEAFQLVGTENSPTGAIACWGPTDLYTHTWFNNTLSAEFYNLLLNQDVSYLGALCVGAEVSLLRNYPSSRQDGNGQTVGYYFYTFALLGDPGLQVWTHTPRTVLVDFNREIAVGATLISVTVTDQGDDPIAGAYVHILSADEEIRVGGFTDEQGRLAVSTDPLIAGEYKLTVTGPAVMPVRETITVARQAQYLALRSFEIDDDPEGESQGNDDGRVNPGEIIELPITLINSGSERTDACASVLRTTSPGVELIRDEVEYPELDPNQAAPGGQTFVLRVLPQTPSGEKINLNLQVTLGEQRFRSSMTLEVVGYDFEITDYLFLDDELYPGTAQQLLLTVHNRGEVDSDSLTATLYCADPKIQIRQHQALLGRILQGESRENEDQLFEVFAAPNAYLASEMPFGLLLEDRFGRRDSLTFTTLLGAPSVSAPQADDGYGYWAFDTRDTTSGEAPRYNWLAGANNLNLTDNDDRQNVDGTHGSRGIVQLPFEFVYYGQPYGEITVSTNGWLSFGRSDLVSWNNQELGSALAPPAQLAVYWEDLFNGQVFTRYDEDNARFIIEWRNYQSSRGSVTCAVHLFDPTTVVTNTGDGEFNYVFNNLQVGRRDYQEEEVTIGFTSPDHHNFMRITHAGTWNVRTSQIQSNMAIRFTTGEFSVRGGVHGRVTNAADGGPVRDVRVMLDGTGFFALTDAQGEYLINRAPVGEYNVTALLRHYNAAQAMRIEVRENEVAEADFSLTHPVFNAYLDRILKGVLADSTGQVGFDVWNTGNGPLDYRLRLDYQAEPGGGRDNPWDLRFNFGGTDSTGDNRLQGVTYDGDLLYVSGAFAYREFPHKIYVFDRDGRLVRTFDQTTVDSSASYGYNELAFNGENLLAVEKNNILEITREGEVVHITPAPEHPTTTVAWTQARGSIITKSTAGRRFYEIDREGNVLNDWSIGDEGYRAYGLEWFEHDPEGFKLYIFSDNPVPEEVGGSRLMLSKLNPETGEVKLVRYIMLN